VRRTRLGGSRQGENRGLRGRGGLITFLATAGVLGIVSGFALAAPGGQGAGRIHSARAPHTVTPREVTTTTEQVTTTFAADTTITTTIPCVEQAHREVAPATLTTIASEEETVTETLPGSTETTTEPDSTETITQEGTTQTVTQPGSTITQTQPDSTTVRTVPGSAVVTTIPGTTETVTDCTSSTFTATSSTESTSTGAVLGTSTSGGTTRKLPTEKSQDRGKKNGGGNETAVATATGASGGLPFTGMQVPLLILVGFGMGAAGLVLRQRLGSLD
jgi:hypothetical protein